MSRKWFFQTLLITILFSALLNHTTFSYGVLYESDCSYGSKPPPVDCVYTCPTCECCPGVMTIADAVPREGEQDFQCRVYTWISDTDRSGSQVDISSQPTKVPFQPFKSADVPYYETRDFCNKGGDRACCIKRCTKTYSGTEKPKYDVWGNFIGYNTTSCIEWTFQVDSNDPAEYIYYNSWTAKTLPYSSMCSPTYSELPRDPLDADIKCYYNIADFDRICLSYYNDPLVGPFEDCEMKVTVPVQTPCPVCATFCAAGNIVCPAHPQL